MVACRSFQKNQRNIIEGEGTLGKAGTTQPLYKLQEALPGRAAPEWHSTPRPKASAGSAARCPPRCRPRVSIPPVALLPWASVLLSHLMLPPPAPCSPFSSKQKCQGDKPPSLLLSGPWLHLWPSAAGPHACWTTCLCTALRTIPPPPSSPLCLPPTPTNLLTMSPWSPPGCQVP